jgi:hypothetical protein
LFDHTLQIIRTVKRRRKGEYGEAEGRRTKKKRRIKKKLKKIINY